MNTQPHLLVVDDDLEIRKLLGRYLSEQGFRVSLSSSKQECDECLATHKIDIVILDVLLPDGSGLDICQNIRQQSPDIVVILVTALREDIDRIVGLEIGADDYLGKPFNPRELLARIRAIIRRTKSNIPTSGMQSNIFKFAGLIADAEARSVRSSNGAEIDFTGAEFELLRMFLDRPGRILTRDQLLDLTQGRNSGPFNRSIDVLISRIRKKLSQHSNELFIKTVRNGGYQLVIQVERLDGMT